MARNYTNTACPLYGSSYCYMLNMAGCESCTVNLRKKDEILQLKEDLAVLRSLMPEDGISDLFTGDTCVLCKGEQKGKTECYGVLDLAHPQPERMKRSAIFVKVKARAGSIVPVQLSCCSACRRRFRMIDALGALLVAVVAAVLIVLLSIRPVNEAMVAVWRPLPFVLFVGGVALSLVAGLVARHALKKRYSKKTHLDVFELPKLAQMKGNGWFVLSESRAKGVTKLIFSKKRMLQGVYTGDKQDYAPEAEESAAEEQA